MKIGHVLIGTVLLTGMLAGPAPRTARAQDAQHDQNGNTDKRYYDAEHKDYHNWDDNEDKAWRQYQTDQHQKYRDFSKASKKDQADYWKWRHDHPDSEQSH